VKTEIGKKDFWRCGNVTLYRGDCREVLGKIGRADAVITDPPWGIGFPDIGDPRGDYFQWLWPLIQQAERKICPGSGWCCVFQSAKRLRECGEGIPRAWRPIAFARNFVQIMKNPGPLWATDYALLWSVNRPTVRRVGRDFFDAGNDHLYVNIAAHPRNPVPGYCPRPVEEMTFLVHMLTEENQTVLDPFAGSGTTAIACVFLRRRFVGIEINPRLFSIAKGRIRQALEETGQLKR
jgi:DNA modification methylase